MANSITKGENETPTAVRDFVYLSPSYPISGVALTPSFKMCRLQTATIHFPIKDPIESPPSNPKQKGVTPSTIIAAIVIAS